MTENNIATNRRSFLKISAAAGGGMILGFPWFLGCKEEAIMIEKALPNPSQWFDITGYIKIGDTGLVTIYSPNPEIGQNVKTSMPMIVAEELDVDWKDVVVEQAPLNTDHFKRQVAGGSQSIRKSWTALRTAGATVKQMLMEAAAKKWDVEMTELSVTNGQIKNAVGEVLSYGELANAVVDMEIPTDVKLKDPKDFKIIGQGKTNVDLDKIVTGQPLFGIDTKEEGMVYAVVSRPPGFGMQLSSFDDTAAKKVNGVIDVIKFDDTHSDLRSIKNEKIAVIANSTWAAMKGRKALKLEWSNEANDESTSNHDEKLSALLTKKSDEARRNDGDVEAAFAEADAVLERVYEAPFLPHNCLEPMNFFADVSEGTARLIGPVQTPEWTRSRVMKYMGLEEGDEAKVSIDMTRMGGGFGRRLYGDFALEAVQISEAIKKPVQLLFSREDDMMAGTYRPASKYRMKAAIKDNEITAYHLTEACVNGNMYKNIVNFFPAGSIPNMRIDTNSLESKISTGAWRAPYTNFLAFAEQSFFDELAKEMEVDEVQLRLDLYEKAKANKDADYEYDPDKAIAVTKLACEKAGWGNQGSDLHQGFCMYYSHNTHVAEIADVVMINNQAVIKKITCAIHCGIVVNPKGAINQVEGGIIDGIGHAMYGQLNFENGKPSADNFNQYRLIRMGEIPEIDVHFVESMEDPTGLGEPSLPPAAGAVANAIFKATGKRLYKQPFIKEMELES